MTVAQGSSGFSLESNARYGLALFDRYEFQVVRRIISDLTEEPSFDGYCEERYAQLVGYAFAGLKSALVQVRLVDYLFWLRNRAGEPTLLSVDEFATRIACYQAHPEWPVRTVLLDDTVASNMTSSLSLAGSECADAEHDVCVRRHYYEEWLQCTQLPDDATSLNLYGELLIQQWADNARFSVTSEDECG